MWSHSKAKWSTEYRYAAVLCKDVVPWKLKKKLISKCSQANQYQFLYKKSIQDTSGSYNRWMPPVMINDLSDQAVSLTDLDGGCRSVAGFVNSSIRSLSKFLPQIQITLCPSPVATELSQHIIHILVVPLLYNNSCCLSARRVEFTSRLLILSTFVGLIR